MLKSILDAKKEIDILHQKIKETQERCPHPEEQLEKIYRADTGNWCSLDDRWWTNFKCKRCGKFWTCDSKEDHDGYRRKAKVVEEFSE